jgi:flagellar protein FliS
MTADELRNRYLRDRVLTASPAQRVVMLYDRLTLDLARAASATDGQPGDGQPGEHLDHAVQVVTELLASLDVSAGGPSENLSSIYGYLLRELLAVRLGEPDRLPGVAEIVEDLAIAWREVAATAATARPATAAGTLAAGAWVS